MVNPLITGENGVIITGENGIPIAGDVVSTNNEIQDIDFSVDLLKALLWQYNDAENLQSLVRQKQQWYDENQTDFWNNWFNNVFNLNTANEFGLSVWAIILAIPLFISTPPDPDKPTFGFGNANGDVNFDNGNFTDSNGVIFNLPLETKRLVLKLRYFQLVSSGTVPETNRMLAYIFGVLGRVFLLDYGTMNQAYIFLFPVSWDLAYIFNNLDILPRPAGVGSQWIDGTLSYFGFGPDGLNFDNGILFG